MQKYKHKILAAVIAIPVAFLLWLYVVTVVSPDSTQKIYNIPVTFEGDIVLSERNLMRTSESASIDLEIRGDRVKLQKLNNENIRVVADVSKISEAGNYSVTLTVSFPDVSGNGGFEIIHKSKSEVEVSIANVITKPVPVTIDVGDSEAKEGFFYDSTNALAEPAEITISGPDFAVDEVFNAVIDCRDISDLEETLIEERPIVLRREDGTQITDLHFLTVSRQSATVTLPIQKYKDIKLAVEFKSGAGATEENVESVTYSVDTIRVRAGAGQIDKLGDELVLGTIDLSKATSANTVVTFPVSLPNGIKNVNGITEVTVTVKLAGLRTQSFTVDAEQVELLNVPQDRQVTVNVQSILVKLRGLEEEMAAISDKSIKLTIDLSDVTESGEVPATVSVNGHPDIGVLEDVFVDITIE